MRDQILREATRLMAAHGANATSVQSIADAVGIRKASVLYHFPSKEALRKAVLNELLYRWNDVLPRLLLAPSTSGQDRFEAIIFELMSFFASEPDRARLLVRELLDRPEAMEQYLKSYIQPWLHVVDKALDEGRRSGVVQRDIDPTAFALQMTVLSLSSIATADSWWFLLDSDKGTAKVRHLTELARMAHSSLFGARVAPNSTRKIGSFEASSEEHSTQPLRSIKG